MTARPRWLAGVILATTFVAAWIGAYMATWSFVVRDYWVPSMSMAPTVPARTWVDVNLLAKTASRGEVAVFKAPAKLALPPNERIIKRVIAVGGDSVSCCQNNHIMLNGRSLDEPYLSSTSDAQFTFGPVAVPRGSMFMVGDNRGDSADSRAWGPVPVSSITGRVEGPHGLLARLIPLLIPTAMALLLTTLIGAVVRFSWRPPRGI